VSTRIYLVRHAQSYSNVERRLVGEPPGPGLTERGKAQAQAAAALLAAADRPATAVVTSPLRRARETAAAAAARLGAALRVDDRLRETRFGAWEGMTVEQLVEESDYAAWRHDRQGHRPPGGERMSDLAQRVSAAVADLANETAGGAVALFSHQDPITAFLLTVQGLPWTSAALAPVTNALIATLESEGGRLRLIGIDRRAFGAEPAAQETA
jgi:broad specificity phosphatase PhoE